VRGGERARREAIVFYCERCSAKSLGLDSALATARRRYLEATAKRLVEKDSTLTKNSVHNFLQDKLVVCDDQVATGSFNFSKSATKNAENSLILHDAALAVQCAPPVGKMGAAHSK
jgi:phosphatidylserine/phosphatidylglycerophosphate/cardiolipin synthase-like enzyme